MKVVVAPDKFKGSLTASEVCMIIREAILKANPEADIITLPMADGGEGTLDMLEAHKDTGRIRLSVDDPLFRPIETYYLIADGKAYIEMSQASGLQLLNESERNCLHTTTLGTGEMISDALTRGVKEIYLFVGGSATNDAGIGMASALGYSFYDKDDQPIVPIGGNLKKVHRIDSTQLKYNLQEVKVNVVCDVRNVLYGKKGAAYTYALQKGASKKEIPELDSGLRHFANTVKNCLSVDVANVQGAGAAGGLAYGALAFLGAKVLPGISTLMSIIDFENQLKDTDLVITGEGKLDLQTLEGKTVSGVASIAHKHRVPLAIICGICEDQEALIKALQPVTIIPLKTTTISLEKAMANAKELLELSVYKLMESSFGEI